MSRLAQSEQPEYHVSLRLGWAIGYNRMRVREALYWLREGRRIGSSEFFMNEWRKALTWRWRTYRDMTATQERERAEFYQLAGAQRVIGLIVQAAE